VEIWFDWAFVDFWRSNNYTIQRAIGLDPNTLSSSTGHNVETSMLMSSLRDQIQNQAKEIEALRVQLKQEEGLRADEVTNLKAQLTELNLELSNTLQKKGEVDKELEDLLVYLDELSTKRRADKARMKDAGLQVSEGEDDDEEADEE